MSQPATIRSSAPEILLGFAILGWPSLADSEIAIVSPAPTDGGRPGIHHSRRLPLGLTQALEEISALRSIEDNWNGYGSPAPTLQAINAARDLAVRLFARSLSPDTATAAGEGGVAFTFLLPAGRQLTIESTNEDDFLVVTSEGRDDANAYEYDHADIDEVVEVAWAFVGLQGTSHARRA